MLRNFIASDLFLRLASAAAGSPPLQFGEDQIDGTRSKIWATDGIRATWLALLTSVDRMDHIGMLTFRFDLCHARNDVQPLSSRST